MSPLVLVALVIGGALMAAFFALATYVAISLICWEV